MTRYAQTGNDLKPTPRRPGIKDRVRAVRSGFQSFVRIVLMTVACIAVGVIGLVICVIVMVARAPRTDSAPSYSSQSYSPPAVADREREVYQPSSTPGKTSSGFQESEAEKAYERKHGVEVVHKKDGTTYERKQARKK